MEEMRISYNVWSKVMKGRVWKSLAHEENNIKIYLKRTECKGMDWICLTQGRVQCLAIANIVMDL
jgi:hypothetical protein